METVFLKPLQHRGQECIGIYFAKNSSIQLLVQKNAGGKWSSTHKCWYTALSEKIYHQLTKALSGNAILQIDDLKKYLLEKRNRLAVQQNKAPTKIESKKNTVKDARPLQQPNSMGRLSKENIEALQKFKQQLILKSYSAATLRTYTNEFQQFLQTIGKVAAPEFDAARIKDYLQYCFEKLKLSENTLHSRMNALKFYYESVLKREKFFWEIPRPKKPLQLPRFFNPDEIAAIIKAAANLKHKVMLMLAYSGGLRVSEVVTIKTYNIDSKRMSIFIENAKGKKDRIVTLSPVLLIMLREYWKAYNPEKSGYLFAGQFEGEPYSTRSLQMVLNSAKKKAGIIKPGSVHALRHSFATHLLDKGTDVTMIMKLLGHNDLKTTLRYLHVTNRDMLHIVSPLDNLKLD